jgi:exodeoxyribonuclease X
MSAILIRVIDVETTDEPPDAAVCEVGWSDVTILDDARAVSDPVAMLINPGRPISASARGVHHISDADVLGAPPFGEATRRITDGPPFCFAAHRADFEKAFMPEVYFGTETIRWIDTWKVALRLWPDLKDHKNQTLRYHLGFDDKIEGFTAKAMPPHRAGPDAFATAHLLNAALDFASLDDLVKWSAEPAALPRINFGTKHVGQPWSEAESDYLVWIIEKSTLDADTKWNAQRELDRRLDERRAEYVLKACDEIDRMETVEALERWWAADGAIRADLKIAKGTPAYRRIATAGSERRKALARSKEAAST